MLRLRRLLKKLHRPGARSARGQHGRHTDRNLVPEPASGLDPGDEARVGQQGTHAYIWAPIGARPLMVRDNRHDTAYIFGAICPQRGVGAAMITPAAIRR